MISYTVLYTIKSGLQILMPANVKIIFELHQLIREYSSRPDDAYRNSIPLFGNKKFLPNQRSALQKRIAAYALLAAILSDENPHGLVGYEKDFRGRLGDVYQAWLKENEPKASSSKNYKP